MTINDNWPLICSVAKYSVIWPSPESASRGQARVPRIFFYIIVYMAHCTAASSFGLPSELHSTIRWLLVHQIDAQLSMQWISTTAYSYMLRCNLWQWRDKVCHREADLVSLGLPRTRMYFLLNMAWHNTVIQLTFQGILLPTTRNAFCGEP